MTINEQINLLNDEALRRAIADGLNPNNLNYNVVSVPLKNGIYTYDFFTFNGDVFTVIIGLNEINKISDFKYKSMW